MVYAQLPNNWTTLTSLCGEYSSLYTLYNVPLNKLLYSDTIVFKKQLLIWSRARMPPCLTCSNKTSHNFTFIRFSFVIVCNPHACLHSHTSFQAYQTDQAHGCISWHSTSYMTKNAYRNVCGAKKVSLHSAATVGSANSSMHQSPPHACAHAHKHTAAYSARFNINGIRVAAVFCYRTWSASVAVAGDSVAVGGLSTMLRTHMRTIANVNGGIRRTGWKCPNAVVERTNNVSVRL